MERRFPPAICATTMTTAPTEKTKPTVLTQAEEEDQIRVTKTALTSPMGRNRNNNKTYFFNCVLAPVTVNVGITDTGGTFSAELNDPNSSEFQTAATDFEDAVCIAIGNCKIFYINLYTILLDGYPDEQWPSLRQLSRLRGGLFSVWLYHCQHEADIQQFSIAQVMGHFINSLLTMQTTVKQFEAPVLHCSRETVAIDSTCM